MNSSERYAMTLNDRFPSEPESEPEFEKTIANLR